MISVKHAWETSVTFDQLHHRTWTTLLSTACLLASKQKIIFSPSTGRSRSRTRSPNPGRGGFLGGSCCLKLQPLLTCEHEQNHLLLMEEIRATTYLSTGFQNLFNSSNKTLPTKKGCKSNNKTVKMDVEVNDINLNNLVVRRLWGLLMHLMPCILSTFMVFLEASLIVVEWWFLATIIIT